MFERSEYDRLHLSPSGTFRLVADTTLKYIHNSYIFKVVMLYEGGMQNVMKDSLTVMDGREGFFEKLT